MRRALALARRAAPLALPAAALAADCPKTTLGDVEDEVMCSVCGTPLALAEEAPQAQRERAYIQRLIAECSSKDEIKRALVAQFGDRVLALPGDEGDDASRTCSSTSFRRSACCSRSAAIAFAAQPLAARDGGSRRHSRPPPPTPAA